MLLHHVSDHFWPHGFRADSLFLQSETMKFVDSVEFQAAQIMYGSRNNLLPGNVQKIIFEREDWGLQSKRKAEFENSLCSYNNGEFLYFGLWSEIVECGAGAMSKHDTR